MNLLEERARNVVLLYVNMRAAQYDLEASEFYYLIDKLGKKRNLNLGELHDGFYLREDARNEIDKVFRKAKDGKLLREKVTRENQHETTKGE